MAMCEFNCYCPDCRDKPVTRKVYEMEKEIKRLQDLLTVQSTLGSDKSGGIVGTTFKTLIKLLNPDAEHSMVNVNKSTALEYKCDVCNELKNHVINTDNSDGDNNWITICKECCLHILGVL